MWVDTSNYTGALSAEQCADLKNAGFVGIIAQAITGLDGNTYTRQQLQACLDNGLRIAGYIWCFPGVSVSTRLSLFDGFKLESLWLDVEEPLTVNQVNRDLALCDAYQGTNIGIYSGKWFFDQMGWTNQALWNTRPLWDSNYDGKPDKTVNFRPYGGWTECAIKQYWGTSSIGRVHQVDLNAA